MSIPLETRPSIATPAGAVSGRPLLWLRAEGLTLFAVALYLLSLTGQPWWLVPLLIFVPDVFALGYLRNSRVGAVVYNLGHTYPLPASLAVIGFALGNQLLLAIALIWLAHVGMDRAGGYGLKHDDEFKHTHLGHLGHKQARR